MIRGLPFVVLFAACTQSFQLKLTAPATSHAPAVKVTVRSDLGGASWGTLTAQVDGGPERSDLVTTEVVDPDPTQLAFSNGRVLAVPLTSGSHRVTVTLHSTDGGSASASVNVDVQLTAGSPVPDFGFGGFSYGKFDDVSAFLPQGKVVSLIPLPDGKFVSALEDAGHAVLVRQEADGSIDPSFGHHGYAIVPWGETPVSGLVRSLMRDAQGRFIIATDGTGEFPRPLDGLWRFTADGELDASFGDAGRVGIVAGPATLLPNGGTLVVASSAVTLTRLTPDGELDPTFGRQGTARLGVRVDAVRAIAVLADGRIAALANDKASGIGVIIAVARADGTPDPNFGYRGVVQFDIGLGTSLAAAPDGSLYVGGVRPVANDPKHDFAPLVAHVLADGRLDPDFGTQGLADLLPPGAVEADALAVLADGRLVYAGGQIPDGVGMVGGDLRLGGSQPIVGRVLADGTPDPTFGDGGVSVVDVTARPWTDVSGNPPSGGEVFSLALLGDGRLLLGGGGINPGWGYELFELCGDAACAR